MTKLFSKSQLNFALPLVKDARKKKQKAEAKAKKKTATDLTKAAEELLAKRNDGDYGATGPEEVIAEMWRIIHRQCLNRKPDDHDMANIRDLKSKSWEVAAVASGLELNIGTVSDCWNQ